MEKKEVTETIILKYKKELFTPLNVMEEVRKTYKPCCISINDLDDQEYHIVTINKL